MRDDTALVEAVDALREGYGNVMIMLYTKVLAMIVSPLDQIQSIRGLQKPLPQRPAR